ncbi:MAG: hypothetical protein FWG74_01500, partial [Planctomycetes bacterium]|nr:hypothetical protein [Planctomycetota bacterium]
MQENGQRLACFSAKLHQNNPLEIKGLNDRSGRRESNPHGQLGRLEPVKTKSFNDNTIQNRKKTLTRPLTLS